MLRHSVGPDGDPGGLLLNLWAVVVEVDDLVRISFDTCAADGITPEELVGDDHEPTQALGERLRAAGRAGVIVPSAALPGTENVVLFGPRVLHPYLVEPLSAEEIPTGHLSDGARPAAEVAPLVRWYGQPHAALVQWRAAGRFDRLDDPLASRW
jgi:hypothetical protein